MEQEKNDSEHAAIRDGPKVEDLYLQIGVFLSILGISAYALGISYATPIQEPVYLSIFLVNILYFVEYRIRKLALLSLAWVLLSVTVISILVLLGGSINALVIFGWSAIFIAGYEFNQFAFVTRKISPANGNLDELSFKKYRTVVTYLVKETLLVAFASVIFSVVTATLSEGIIPVATNPLLEVTVLAYLSILMISLVGAISSRQNTQGV